MQIEISTLTNTGGRATNEDAAGFWSDAGHCYCVVSDGAGGHGGGDVAARLAVTTVLEVFQRRPECSQGAIAAALDAANEAVIVRAASDERLARMRATAVVLCCDAVHRTAAWGHIGDSRLYYFRNRRIAQQTRDHSVVQSMVDAGYIHPDALRAAPHRSQLFAALGEREEFAPALAHAEIGVGDAFLLCTDGVWEHVIEPEFERMLADATTAADWLSRIESKLLTQSRERLDNFSALAVCCRPTAAAHVDPEVAE
jgi:serine/threonine protein phosphatase PrpC